MYLVRICIFRVYFGVRVTFVYLISCITFAEWGMLILCVEFGEKWCWLRVLCLQKVEFGKKEREFEEKETSLKVQINTPAHSSEGTLYAPLLTAKRSWNMPHAPYETDETCLAPYQTDKPAPFAVWNRWNMSIAPDETHELCRLREQPYDLLSTPSPLIIDLVSRARAASST